MPGDSAKRLQLLAAIDGAKALMRKGALPPHMKRALGGANSERSSGSSDDGANNAVVPHEDSSDHHRKALLVSSSGGGGEVSKSESQQQPQISEAAHASIGEYVLGRLRISNLPDYIQQSETIALQAGDSGKKPLTHGRLHRFLSSELSLFGILGVTPKDCLGVVLPGGPELATCVITVASQCCCAPVNVHNTVEEIVNDLAGLKCRAVIVREQASQELISALQHAGMVVAFLIPDTQVVGLFSLTLAQPLIFQAAEPLSKPLLQQQDHRSGAPQFTGPSDPVLVLYTSGTSGKKKIVPYPLETIIVGAACLIAAGDLQPHDINLNLMPLYHIGGIARNLFAPVLSGGSALMLGDFDPQQFWDSAQSCGATWYYAAPTMHHMILQEGKSRNPTPKTHIRMIVNAAGGLLPSLALELRQMFKGATVLPSYGMTECMPISSPPITYNLEFPGTSGRPIGPEVSIRDTVGRPLPLHEVGV